MKKKPLHPIFSDPRCLNPHGDIYYQATAFVRGKNVYATDGRIIVRCPASRVTKASIPKVPKGAKLVNCVDCDWLLSEFSLDATGEVALPELPIVTDAACPICSGSGKTPCCEVVCYKCLMRTDHELVNLGNGVGLTSDYIRLLCFHGVHVVHMVYVREPASAPVYFRHPDGAFEGLLVRRQL